MCRCIGYDSPEMKGPAKENAIIARDYLRSIVPRFPFLMHYDGFDEYGRLLVRWTIRNEWLCEHMIMNGYGYAYNGETKKKS